MDRSIPVAVVGAGIAGLAAALSLAKAGFRVDVFERTKVLEEAGAGLQLSPNVLRVLKRLGLEERLRKAGVASDTVMLRSGHTGRPIAEVPVLAEDGTSYLSIHRADLQQALLNAVTETTAIRLHLGWKLVGCAVDPEAASLRFERSVGEIERRMPIVIAADGVHSQAAAALGLAPAKATGATACRMLLPANRVTPERLAPAGTQAWLGGGRHAVAYPVRDGAFINLVLICPARDLPETDDERIGGETLLAVFRDWDPRLLAMISAAGAATPWPLFQVGPERRWDAEPALLLIGDAAHATLPYAAQGAAMAIEDGWVAAHAFATAATRSEAIRLYETLRRPRIRQVHRRTLFHQTVYHLPRPLSLGRDLALRVRSPEALRRDLSWLYDWRPPEL